MRPYSTFLAAVFFPLAAHGVAMAPKAGSGDVKFIAIASPGALSIQGKGDTPEGKMDVVETEGKLDVSGSLKIKLDTLKTGLSLRDSHMKDKYLEAGKYPEAQLHISKQSFPKDQAGPFEGEFEIHGAKHKVTGTAEVKMQGAVATVKAKFPVKLQEHNITAPSFAGITVADEVVVETEFQLVNVL